MSPVIKCLCAACLNQQCRSMKCTACKTALTMTSLTLFDASCLFGYINGQVSTIGRDRILKTYLRMDMGETTKYASILKTILRGYTFTKWTRAHWMSFHDKWTSCNDLAEFDHLQVHMERIEWRMCVDYRALNTQTVGDRYPLPSIQAILSTLRGCTVLSKMDPVSGSHQIQIHDEDIPKTVFNTQCGAFEWVVMPFGLCNALSPRKLHPLLEEADAQNGSQKTYSFWTFAARMN